jgi:plasmid stabilization system protein ParE
MPRYRVSRKAIRDLNSIWYAIAKDNEPAADRWIERVESLFRTIAA